VIDRVKRSGTHQTTTLRKKSSGGPRTIVS
jgi:hypothetical protein